VSGFWSCRDSVPAAEPSWLEWKTSVPTQCPGWGRGTKSCLQRTVLRGFRLPPRRARHERLQLIRSIARALGRSENAVQATLYRMRRAISAGSWAWRPGSAPDPSTGGSDRRSKGERPQSTAISRRRS
jgi:hypothetical protein